MEIIGFLAGGAFGAAQYLLARHLFVVKARTGLYALYIAQLLILSLGLLVLVFFLWRVAMLPMAVGFVAVSIIMAVALNLKK